jgi:SpoVK/Ycf46/Vps4 family AAA+-type ATPase
MFTSRMPTVNVDLDRLAAGTEGFSPADLRALTQEAALAAMARQRGEGAGGSETATVPARVEQEDFDEGLRRLTHTQT